MTELSPVTYRPRRDPRPYSVSLLGTELSISREGQLSFAAEACERGSEVQLNLKEGATLSENDFGPGLAMEYLFGHRPELTAVHLHIESGPKILTMKRTDFFQQPDLWLADRPAAPETWTETAGRKHPVRPKAVPGTAYQRFVPGVGKTISFRLIDIKRDLKQFHDWHNQPRVADLWELAKPIDELEAYLTKGLSDPHSIPMILEFDGEAAGYFEIYWTPEDRLAPYYDSSSYDRGFHFLIGEEKFLGRANTDAALRSVTHFLFLDDSRTDKILGEPRADNKRVLKYVESVPGWRFVKEFDFPHKRAALVMCERDGFFEGGGL